MVNSMQADFDDVKKIVFSGYQKFPDKTNFVPRVNDGQLKFYYSDMEGFRKALFLANNLGLKASYESVDKRVILEVLESISGELNIEIDATKGDDGESVEDILSATYQDAPIIGLVNQIIVNAVKADASDIHFENGDDFFIVRYRVDGILRTVRKFQKGIHSTIVARLKVMAMLDVSETRKPQDGRINIKVGNRAVDMRVSTIPSTKGEKVVLRVLEKTKGLISLDNLGIPEKFAEKYKNYIKKPNGIILVTGPTGSGKTTTLYASLMELDRETKNIVTIEDPVEYQIEKITQVQVNPVVNLTFASAIKSFLRQDPDIILVGEIRDEETAKAAVQASLTGHLVLSTLHTNDAPTAVARLIDMGVEPFLVASSLLLVVGQRLVRKVCEHCKQEKIVDDSEKKLFGNQSIDFDKYFVGKGCHECMNTGYKGRIAIYEFLEIDDEIRKLVTIKASSKDIERQARKKGYKSLVEEGMRLIKEGKTTMQEVIAVTQFE
ncbi:MAG: ral secretion pathway protein [Deferribacteraceae bacterium]|jgi:general secretion pathway protein E|nr:ral secretion pathway protein [Deferribacteraceae bacterium]